MKNIKQLTNFDMAGAPTTQTFIRKYYVSDDPAEREKIVQYPYYTITPTKFGGNVNTRISKLGYCCSPRGIGYPIFIKLDTESDFREIEIGKTGMFEFQEEEWKNINQDNNVREAKVLVSEIKVPVDISFVLDYVFDIN